MVDWGLGNYEYTATQLLPVAERVVALAGIEPEHRVLDLGAGTGNAALIAARSGARVTAADPAPRLLRVADERAAAESLELETVEASAEELPFADGAFDRVLCVFSVIFSPEPERAFAETLRVVAPGGAALITAWIPEGAISEMVGVFRRAMASLGPGPGGNPFPWHDPDAIERLAGEHGASVTVEEAELAFEGDSPEAYFAAEQANHPMSLAMRPALERAGIADRVAEEALDVLRHGNEVADGFRVTSRYRIFTVS